MHDIVLLKVEYRGAKPYQKHRQYVCLGKWVNNTMDKMDTHVNLFQVNKEDFEEKVLKSHTPVIVDFWAAWCGPCRAIAPVYEKLSDEYKDKLTFAKMNIDASEENNRLAGHLKVQAIPTLVIFKKGEEIGRMVGASPSALKGEIDRILAKH